MNATVSTSFFMYGAVYEQDDIKTMQSNLENWHYFLLGVVPSKLWSEMAVLTGLHGSILLRSSNKMYSDYKNTVKLNFNTKILWS
jgi:hypothetical protein